MKNLEELIYNKLAEKAKKPNPKDHTTLSIEDMEDAVRKAQSAKMVADNKKLRKNIPGDEYRKLPTVSDKFQIIVPMSTRASCLYGAGTKWCTAAAADNQFNRYYNRWGMTLYYILPKKVDVDWDVVDAEKEDFHNQLDDLFEGKVEDLQKKYPEWDISAFKDPSGKNKYLDWMVKTAVSIGDTKKYSTNRVNDLIADYHKLLPYIGREEKPEKKKEKGQRQERTRFDKVAIVMHPEGYRTKMYDAQDKEIELKELISFIMPTWGIDPKEGLDMFGEIDDAIDADMKENPNPVRDRMNKIKGAVDSLNDALESNYHDNLKPNFFDDPEKASRTPVAYGTLKNYRVEPGEMVVPFTANFYFPIPDEIGGYEKITKDRTFRGNDRGRLQNFKDMLRNNMQLWRPAATMVSETFKSFDAAKEKYTKKLQNEFGEEPGKSRADTIFQRRPKDDTKAPAPEADIEYVGPVTKQRFIFMDLRMMVKIRDTVGAIDEGGLDETMLNVVGDIRNFMEDGIQKVKEQAWEEFQFMAKRWMEQNPRKSPEEEKAETEKSVEDIMTHLPEEKQTMSLEEKILAKLMGEEEILLEVDYEQAQASLTGKPAQKLVKSFNFDQGKDPMDNMSKLVTTIRNTVMTTVPHDVLPGEVANDPSMDPIGKEKEIEKRRALGIMWMLRLLKKDKELTAMLLGNDPTHRWQSTSRAIKQDMEKFFQHNRHMKVKDLNQLQTADDLNKVVTQAQKSIDAENDKKMSADAVSGTEFFAGGYKFETDEEGNQVLDNKGNPIVARDEEGIPLFRFSKDGWVIAAAHNKGAACLLGKKTNWCTAAIGLNYFDTYYNGKDDPLFFIHTPSEIDKDGGWEKDGDRFQFAFGCDDCPQFMDVEDTPVRGDEFETLHNKLKDVLRDNGFEDRFEVVFEYEHFDFEEAVDNMVKDYQRSIDNPQVHIYGEVEEDYDSMHLNAGFQVAFVYSFDADTFTPVDDIYDTAEVIAPLFNELTNMSAGNQEDYGDDLNNYIDYDAGHSTVKIEINGHWTGYTSNNDKSVLEEMDNFLNDVDSNIDGRYEEIKAKIQIALTESGALPLTKYDKLLYSELAVWDGEHANQDDEDEPGEYGDPNDRPEPKDLSDRQEAFEEQFKNVLVAFDDDAGEIRFQGLRFPSPAPLANDEVSIIGDVPRNKNVILHRALNTMHQIFDKQPNLPGFEGGDEDALDRMRGVISRNDVVGYMYTQKSLCKLEIEMKLGALTEEEMDAVTAGMKVIDSNFRLFQIAMRDALERYIKMNPDDVRWEKDKPKPPEDGVRQGGRVGATLGAPVRAESKQNDLTEIVTDVIIDALNEIEPYQKKAKKWQKKALQAATKGPNKGIPKGMKVVSTKPGKSAPPGG